MAPISCAIDVDRPPEEVFAYVTDPTRFHEWQKNVEGGHAEGGDPLRVGAKCVTTRRIGLMKRPVTSEIAVAEPPQRWAVRGIDGPIRAQVDVRVEPFDDASRSRLTIAIDFEGHGIGALLVPLLVRREARAEMPANLQALKQRVEAGGESPQ
jgi:carbon monoxide dehydrogenase subunit G